MKSLSVPLKYASRQLRAVRREFPGEPAWRSTADAIGAVLQNYAHSFFWRLLLPEVHACWRGERSRRAAEGERESARARARARGGERERARARQRQGQRQRERQNDGERERESARARARERERESERAREYESDRASDSERDAEAPKCRIAHPPVGNARWV